VSEAVAQAPPNRLDRARHLGRTTIYLEKGEQRSASVNGQCINKAIVSMSIVALF
jgi:hypothetical protein